MEPLRGINHHLPTSCADPLSPQRKPRGVMDDSREKEKEGGGEWKKSESMAVSSLMWCLWGLHELTINSLCRFSEWGIETDCLLAIQLRSSVPRDKKKKKKKKRRKQWLWGRITHKAVFWNISFLFCRHRPYGKTPIPLCALTHTYTPPSEVTILKTQTSAKTETLKNSDLSPTLLIASCLAMGLVRENRSYWAWRLFVHAWHLKAEIIFTHFSSRRTTYYTSVAFAVQTVRHWCYGWAVNREESASNYMEL